MASVTVKVDISQQALENAVNSSPEVRSAINSMSASIASRANGMATEKSGIWVDVGEPHHPERTGGKWNGRSGPTIGGKDPVYQSKPARRFSSGLVGIVYAGNYAAQKDNYQHNTLLKAKG